MVKFQVSNQFVSRQFQILLIMLRCLEVKRLFLFLDIPVDTKIQISKIISRHRKLNPETLGLFLGPDETVVELFDCAYLPEPILSTIPM